MKRRDLIHHLARHGCVLLREGRSHTIFEHQQTVRRAPVPRHREISEPLVKAICKQLDVPPP